MDELEMKPWADMTLPECTELMARVRSAVIEALPPDTEGLIILVCGGDRTTHSASTMSAENMVKVMRDFAWQVALGNTY